jgi:hypothetical protein
MEIGVAFEDWINRISKPKEELGGMSVCPFAKGAEYELINTDGSDINPPPWDFELIIYKLPDYYTVFELTEIAKEYNNMYPEMVFLPDHKDKDTYINGVQTNNGEHNIILCQWRDNLTKARDKLKNTTYYQFWSEDYLQEILTS